MRIADTSALYAAFDEDDAHHAASRRSLADPDPILIPAEIFSETIALLHYRAGAALAVAAGEALVALPHVRLAPSPSDRLGEAWTEYAAAAGALSYPDAIVVAWSKGERARPLTHNRQIARRASKRD